MVSIGRKRQARPKSIRAFPVVGFMALEKTGTDYRISELQLSPYSRIRSGPRRMDFAKVSVDATSAVHIDEA